MKTLLGAFFFTIIISVATAQPEISSLEKQLAASKADTNRVLILSNLVMGYLNSNHDMSMKYAQQGIALARALKFPRGEADCLRRSGIVHHHQGRYPEALDIFQKALTISETINDFFGIGSGLTHVGHIYNAQGQYAKARSYYFRALKISEARKDVLEQGNALSNIGGSYLQEDNLDSASVAYNKAYKLFDKLINSKPTNRLARFWNELGQLQAKMGNEKEAMAFFRKSITIATDENGYSILSQAYLGIADLYSKTGQRDSSILYAQQALTAD